MKSANLPGTTLGVKSYPVCTPQLCNPFMMHRCPLSRALCRQMPGVFSPSADGQMGRLTSSRSYSDEPPSKSAQVLHNLLDIRQSPRPLLRPILTSKPKGPASAPSSGARPAAGPKIISFQSIPKLTRFGPLRGAPLGAKVGAKLGVSKGREKMLRSDSRLPVRGGDHSERFDPRTVRSLDGTRPQLGTSRSKPGFRSPGRPRRPFPSDRLGFPDPSTGGSVMDPPPMPPEMIAEMPDDLKEIMGEMERLGKKTMMAVEDPRLAAIQTLQEDEKLDPEMKIKKIRWHIAAMCGDPFARLRDQLTPEERKLIAPADYQRELDLQTVTKFEPEVTVDSLAGWLPGLATADGYGTRGTAAKNLLVLGGGQPYGEDEMRDERADFKRFRLGMPVFYNTVEEKEWVARVWKRKINAKREPNDTTKTAIKDYGLRGLYEAPKPAELEDTVGTSHTKHVLDGTYLKKDINAFEDKLRSLLPQTRPAWLKEQRIARRQARKAAAA